MNQIKTKLLDGLNLKQISFVNALEAAKQTKSRSEAQRKGNGGDMASVSIWLVLSCIIVGPVGNLSPSDCAIRLLVEPDRTRNPKAKNELATAAYCKINEV